MRTKRAEILLRIVNNIIFVCLDVCLFLFSVVKIKDNAALHYIASQEHPLYASDRLSISRKLTKCLLDNRLEVSL